MAEEVEEWTLQTGVHSNDNQRADSVMQRIVVLGREHRFAEYAQSSLCAFLLS